MDDDDMAISGNFGDFESSPAQIVRDDTPTPPADFVDISTCLAFGVF